MTWPRWKTSKDDEPFHMPDTRRNELARCLADIDQCLAKAEAIAAEPEDDLHESALDFLIEFQEARQAVEVELRGEHER
jgi:hypothetical protein